MTRRHDPLDGQLSMLDDLPASQIAAPPAPLDQAARDQIGNDLAETLFVEAGAGAGKTTALAGRIVALVRCGVPITAIAAITFTEKAAAELRAKARDILAERLIDPAETDEHRRLLRMALDDVDGAPIGTLHAFAGRLLREFPVEAGLPPAFTVLDEVASDIAFEERWSTHLLDTLDDPEPAQVILYARRDGLRIDGLRRLARAFGDGWDLVRERVDRSARPPPPPSLDRFVDRMEELVDQTDPPDGDKVAIKLIQLGLRVRFLRAAAADPFLIFDDSSPKLFASRNLGNKVNWKKSPAGEAGLHEFRAALDDLGEEWEALQTAHRATWHLAVGASIARFTLDAAAQRQARGELEFHDLLVLARDVIAGNDRVRTELHHRYPRILIDEFQDTDPVQLEIAVRLAADPELPQPQRLARPPADRRPVVLRRRPETVDLSLPSRRYRPVPAGRRPARGSITGADHQLPVHPRGARLGEPHVRQPDRRGAPMPSRLTGRSTSTAPSCRLGHTRRRRTSR